MKKIISLLFIILLFGLIIFIKIDFFNKFEINDFEDTIKNEDIPEEEVIDENKPNYINNQVGYIKIDDTNIDALLMQYTDNDYYLTHDENGNYSIFGSIYMDYRNNIDDKKILIFGHNTKNAKVSPFKDLEKYGNESFYQNHSIINLELNGTLHQYKIFSVIVTSNKSNKHMKLGFKDNEWEEHLNWLVNDSIYDTNTDVNTNDFIITLQTCYYEPDQSFIIISAKRI